MRNSAERGAAPRGDGVAPAIILETRLVESLPEELAGSLPTVEEMEAELDGSTTGREP